LQHRLEIAAVKGEKKMSGFKRFIVGLDAAITKLTTGIDMNKIAQQKLGEEIEKQKEKAKQYEDAYKAIASTLKEKVTTALQSVKNFLGLTSQKAGPNL